MRTDERPHAETGLPQRPTSLFSSAAAETRTPGSRPSKTEPPGGSITPGTHESGDVLGTFCLGLVWSLSGTRNEFGSLENGFSAWLRLRHAGFYEATRVYDQNLSNLQQISKKRFPCHRGSNHTRVWSRSITISASWCNWWVNNSTGLAPLNLSTLNPNTSHYRGIVAESGLIAKRRAETAS